MQFDEAVCYIADGGILQIVGVKLLRLVWFFFFVIHWSTPVYNNWVNLRGSNLKMNSKFGCSHHKGMKDIVSIPDPANSEAPEWAVVLLEENTNNF